VAQLRAQGRWVDDEVLAHIWPSHHENVNFYGSITVDIEQELAALDANGYRPLRPTAGRDPATGTDTAVDTETGEAE
jgi:hypothetical protein